MQNIRTAVIGYGNMGSAHAAAIAAGKVPGLELTAICDCAPERLKAAKERYPDLWFYDEYRAMLTLRVAEAVIIAVPHPMHAEIAMAALRAGMHVLTEKPVDVRVSQARALNEASAGSDRVFAIMFNQRTNPLFQRARSIVREGKLGALKRSVWIVTNWYRTQRYYDSGDWRATWAGEGGGVLLNQAPHNLDLWQWICGMPTHVRAVCDVARYHRIEVEDEAVLYTRYEGGATGVFITSTGDFPGTNRLEISGEQGKLVLEGGRLRWWRLWKPEPEVRFGSRDSFASIPSDFEEYTPSGPENGHIEVLRNFADAIRHGAKLIAPGVEGIHELSISNAAYLSAWTGGAEVPLPLDAEAFDRLLDERIAASGPRQAEGESASAPKGRYSDRWSVRW